MDAHTPETPMSTGLHLYWYEIGEGDEPGARWGQFAGGMHRLIAIREDLEAVTRDRDIERCLHRLVLNIEAFLARAYELRERALTLLAGRTGVREAVNALKNPAKRPLAEARLAQAEPRLTRCVVALLASLDEDTLLRNRHTHEQYLNLGLSTGHGLFDPDDALSDVEHRPRARQRLVALLRREARKLAKEYGNKLTELIPLAIAVLDASNSSPRSR